MDNTPYEGLSDEARLLEKKKLYVKVCHAMQSGVAFDIETWEPTSESSQPETSPKHLRVGVNSAMVDTSAMAKLLVAKGIITEEEYFDAVIDGMVEEVKLYENRLTERTGTKISLGSI